MLWLLFKSLSDSVKQILDIVNDISYLLKFYLELHSVTGMLEFSMYLPAILLYILMINIKGK